MTTNAFDAAPFGELVRERRAKAVDEGCTAETKVQRMPLAAHRRDDGRLVWSGSDVVLGDVTRENPAFTLFDEYSAADADFKNIFDQWLAFRNQVQAWNKINEGGFTSYVYGKIE